MTPLRFQLDKLAARGVEDRRMSSDASRREMSSKSSFPLVRMMRKLGRGIRLRRREIWTLIWVAMGGAAAYFLLPQIGELRESLRSLGAA
jgi:hypothetical protein